LSYIPNPYASQTATLLSYTDMLYARWILRNTPVDTTWHSVCYGNGLFVAVGGDGCYLR